MSFSLRDYLMFLLEQNITLPSQVNLKLSFSLFNCCTFFSFLVEVDATSIVNSLQKFLLVCIKVLLKSSVAQFLDIIQGDHVPELFLKHLNKLMSYDLNSPSINKFTHIDQDRRD